MAFPSKERKTDDSLLEQAITEEVWKGESDGFWQVDGSSRLTFPTTQVRVTVGKRLQERERPGRFGARLTTTGSKARRYIVTIPLDASLKGVFELPLYPDMLDALVDSVERVDTGTLFLPVRGIRRCKAETADFEENSEGPQNATMLTITWVEDNEEVVVDSTFSRASVRSSGRRLADIASFTMQKDGVWSGSLSDINELVSELEGIVALPQTTSQDVETRSRIVRHAAERAIRAFETGATEGAQLLIDPLNSGTIRSLVLLQDVASRAEAESFAGKPRTTSYLVTRNRTLQSIAVELRQNYEQLLSLNQYRIEDPAALEDGDVVRVFEVRA